MPNPPLTHAPLTATLIDDIATLVRCESPSDDLAAVAASADVLASLGTRRLGVAPERLVIDGRTHLRWRFGDGPARVLLLGHHDTVWPLGSLKTHPFSVNDDGVMRGPGCFDMKAGIVQALHALSALDERSGVTLLITGDEELGSPSSRALVEREAAGCAAALVLEASADGGALKTARKGAASYEVRVRGKAAHAGLEPERGVNAGVELAHQILRITALGDGEAGTTVTPTAASAGTTANTVPAEAMVQVDVRARTVAEQQRVDRALLGLLPVTPGAAVDVRPGPSRPPLEPSNSAALFALAEEVTAGLGLPALTAAEVGGASDGNLTAGVGTPTLDGLGAVGGGAHADHEHVRVAELTGRTRLLTGLLRRLLEGDSA